MPTIPQSSGLPVDDPASSLRAAALLTLKSKRRKAPVEPAPLSLARPPPPADDTLQLDYGQEDDTPSNPPPPTPTVPSKTQEASAVSTNDIEEGQIREEGEISDEDESPASPLRSPQLEYFKTGPPDAQEASVQSSSTRPSPSAAASPHLPALLERITDPPQYIPMVEDQLVPSEDSAMQDYSPTDDIPIHVDLDHVRPGIPLKQEDYDVAKDIILDLLGWGVPPEYLVDCGLTRQIVYYVFAELNLELPHNLDTSDLIPFTPDVAASVSTRQRPTIQEAPQVAHSGQSLLTRLNLASHISIPRPATPPPPGMEENRSPETNDLLDIERQRRQELLARKAAQASRKPKQVIPPPVEETSSVASSAGISPSQPSKVQDARASPVASEAVDDFLKSIATPVEPPSNLTPPAPPQTNENNMDLDEIPGLGSLSRSSSQAEVANITPTYADQIVVSPFTSDPPTSAEAGNATFSPINQDFAVPAHASSLLAHRRGTKRPVAADFVDLDPAHLVGSRLDLPSRSGSGANFSSIGMKRCVIDLSDSEGEDDGRMRDTAAAAPVKRARSNGYGTPTGSGWNTPAIAPVVPATTSSNAPSALELKIKQMKEEIARREQEMKRASALKPVSNGGSSNASMGGASAPTSVVVKQEEDDSLSSTAMQTDDTEINAQPNEVQQKFDSSIVPLTLSENPSTNVSTTGTPSIADNDTQGGSSSSSVSSPLVTMKNQVPADEGLDGQADSMDSSGDNERRQVQSSHEPGASQQVDVDQEMSTSAEVLLTTSVLPKQDEKQDPSTALSTKTEDIFTTYTSPFESYPLLISHSHSSISGNRPPAMQASYSSSFNSAVTSASAVFPASSVYPSSLSTPYIPTSSSSSSSSNFPLPNLKLLKLTVAAKLLDPSKRICQYEVPGGGVCRDAGCEDLHLSRIMGPSIDGASGVGGIEPNDQDAAEYLFNTLPADWLSRHGITSSKILTALQEVRYKNKAATFEERVAQAMCAVGPPPLPPPP